MGVSLLAAGLGAASSLYGGYQSSKAAKEAAAAQQAGLKKGINASNQYYGEAQNYLSPYVESGTTNLNLMNNIVGNNGTDAQGSALSQYQSSPSANLLQQVQNEALRQTAGQWASNGSYRSGSMIQDLSNRQSQNALNDYYNWQNTVSGLATSGQNAATNASNLASNQGNNLLQAYTNVGNAQASGITGSASAWNNALGNAGQYAANYLGKTSQSNDFSDFFKSTQPATLSSGGWSTTTTPTANGLPNYLSSFLR
jgi:hypothetical protein